IDSAGAGGGGASGQDADLRAECIEQSLPGAISGPVLKVVVDRLPGREIMGQRPPRTTLASMVEKSIDDVAQVGLARSPTPTWPWEEGLEQSPLLVRQITGIRFLD